MRHMIIYASIQFTCNRHTCWRLGEGGRENKNVQNHTFKTTALTFETGPTKDHEFSAQTIRSHSLTVICFGLHKTIFYGKIYEIN